MLARNTVPARAAKAAHGFDFEAFRAAEFARLDEAGMAYLDYTASALYGASQVRAHGERLARSVYGNPHSEHAASRTSAAAVDAARAATLAFFDADADEYDICFTANASAAIKLVAESYPFSPRRGLLLSADNHNSVHGMREFARRAGAAVSTLPLDADLRLEHPVAHLRDAVARHGGGLFAFPQQSNFSGVRHDLSLIQVARDAGCEVLVDAAAAGAYGGLSLKRHPADFVACSFYKLFGLPTGVGALLVKKSAMTRLRRPWFSGGTVEFVSVALQRHALRHGHAGFEDGTPNFLDLAAVESGFEFIGRIPRDALRERIADLTGCFLHAARALRHADGSPLLRVYGPTDLVARGGTVAFNVLRADGVALAHHDVEVRARRHGVAIRGGCFCNPGAAEKALGFDHVEFSRCLDIHERHFSIEAMQQCVGEGTAVGALRLSVGVPTTHADLQRAINLLGTYAG